MLETQEQFSVQRGDRSLLRHLDEGAEQLKKILDLIVAHLSVDRIQRRGQS
jgi:hypothetical protein